MDTNEQTRIDSRKRVTASAEWKPIYSHWRHGGWYVSNLYYPSGAVACVSRNFPDKKWRGVCNVRPHEDQPTFRNRDEAAHEERAYVLDHWDELVEREREFKRRLTENKAV